MPAWSPTVAILVLAVCAGVILFAGIGITRTADRLADRMGWGEAFFGGLLLGGTTSLADTVMTITAAADGFPALGISNALGGIAGQTAFIAIADLTYRRANLEHAAASLPNVFSGMVLVFLLAVPLLAMALPPFAVLGVSPASGVILGSYAFGLYMIKQAHKAPMWLPQQTARTVEDKPDEESFRGSLPRLWGTFLFYGGLLGLTGWGLAQSAETLIAVTPLSESQVGALITGVITSLPELVVSIQAIRRGAITLAIGNILGGNAFDVLQFPLADIAYRERSLYHAIDDAGSYLIALSIVMTCVLVLGLLRRQQHGLANIGWEGAALLAIYLGGMVGLFFV